MPATRFSTGASLVVCHCQSCSYHHEYQEVIPILSGGGGDGGDGGGGGGGDGGGCGGG